MKSDKSKVKLKERNKIIENNSHNNKELKELTLNDVNNKKALNYQGFIFLRVAQVNLTYLSKHSNSYSPSKSVKQNTL